MQTVGVSSMTGAGMDELFEAIDAAAVEYNEYVEEAQHDSVCCSVY